MQPFQGTKLGCEIEQEPADHQGTKHGCKLMADMSYIHIYSFLSSESIKNGVNFGLFDSAWFVMDNGNARNAI